MAPEPAWAVQLYFALHCHQMTVKLQWHLSQLGLCNIKDIPAVLWGVGVAMAPEPAWAVQLRNVPKSTK
jgi:hypothetical protein